MLDEDVVLQTISVKPKLPQSGVSDVLHKLCILMKVVSGYVQDVDATRVMKSGETR
jgi:hypothetical protein